MPSPLSAAWSRATVRLRAAIRRLLGGEHVDRKEGSLSFVSLHLNIDEGRGNCFALLIVNVFSTAPAAMISNRSSLP